MFGRRTARIVFIGDTLLGGDGEAILAERGYDYALEGLRPLLEKADLAVANHEGPITQSSERLPSLVGSRKWFYKADPSTAEALARGGIGAVSLANNHLLDYGEQGLVDTLEALEGAGIAHCGAGIDDAHARRPMILDVGGCRIGFVSLMARYGHYVEAGLYAEGGPGVARMRRSALDSDIESLEGADIRIALVHWGRNYEPVDDRQTRQAAHLRSAGFDLVIGHHPHIAQRVSVTHATPVVYDLGNAAWGAWGRFKSRGTEPYGLVATVEVNTKGLRGMELRLINVDNREVEFRPAPVAHDRFLATLAPNEDGWKAKFGARSKRF